MAICQGFDRVMRLLRLFHHGVKRATITVLDHYYVRINVPGVAGNAHAYLFFPTLTWRMWENHPFSVASTVLPVAKSLHPTRDIEYDSGNDCHASEASDKNHEVKFGNFSDSDESASAFNRRSQRHTTALTFVLRTQLGVTQHLRKHSTVPVLVQGCYGGYHDLSKYITLIAIASDVGITAVLPVLRSHLRRKKLY